MNDNNFEPPKYWDLLKTDDQHIYREMHQAITAPIMKKVSRVEDFREIIDAIDLFENIDDDDKWKRCLVCGIFKVKDMIAVNICQLKYLISKCKSSINGSLRRIGYGKTVKKAEVYELLFESIPYLKKNPSELRKWTMRYFTPFENEQDKEQIINENSDDNLIEDSLFSINEVDLSLFRNNNKDCKLINKNNESDMKTIKEKPKEHMTEPEAEAYPQSNNDFDFNICNIIQPSIFEDKITNWDNSDETSDLYFDYL